MSLKRLLLRFKIVIAKEKYVAETVVTFTGESPRFYIARYQHIIENDGKRDKLERYMIAV